MTKFYLRQEIPDIPDPVDISGIETELLSVASTNNPMWDDMRINLNRGTTGGDPPTMSTFRPNTQAYRFISDATNSLFFDVQIPHSWKEGSTLRPHLHWSPGNSTNTGSVLWGLDYTWANAEDDPDSVFPVSTNVTVADPAHGVAFGHQIASFGNIVGTGKYASSVLMCRVYRDGNNGSDTFTGNAFALSLDFHYQIDKSGSLTEY
jgi:hypothetical protein